MNGFTKKSDWAKIRATINKHLQNAATELGITIPNIKNIAFTAESFRTKIECFAKVDEINTVNAETTANVGTPVSSVSVEELAWKINAHYLPMYGLKLEDYGRKFFAQGEEFSLCAIKPRNHKLPIIGKRADGKRFKFPVSVVKVGVL